VPGLSQGRRKVYGVGTANRYCTGVWLPALALVAAAVGCRALGNGANSEAEPVERVYELHCLGCHGARGEGAWGSNIQDLKRPASEIQAVIANGQGKMPSFQGHLTSAQIAALAERVKSFHRVPTAGSRP